jgi:putative DNA primase/helicase
MIAFQDAIRAAGLIPPDMIEPGRFHKFAGEGKRDSNKAAWCKLFPDGTGGIFGDYSTGLSANWQVQRETSYSPAEREAFKRQVAEAKAEAEAERKAKQAEAAAQATTIWNAPPSALEATQPGVSEHPYLKLKGIQPHGAKIYYGSMTIGGMACNGALMIPMKLNGKIVGLQFISEGEKRFLPGCEKGGFLIGKIVAGKPIYIAEGFATGASIHEATGCAVIVAFDAGNLRKIAEALRAKQPNAVIVLCADDDYQTEGNLGLSKATEAAQAVGGLLAIPVFGANRPDKATDFNDLVAHCGMDAVKQAIDAAKPVLQKADPVGSDLSHSNSVGNTYVPHASPELLPSLPDVLPFDYSYLPDALRGYVKDISERMQCPPDFAAVGVFVMMATIAGRKVGIRPMRHNDWTVICNLWGAVVGNSGVMKSPTLSAALSPINKLAAAAFEIYNKAEAEHDAQAELAKLQVSVNKSEAKTKLKKNKSADVKSLLQSSGTDDAPILKRYKTNNASYEALGELLMENPNGLLVESDEIIGLLKQLDANGQEVARSFYLTAADGDKPYTFDRIMRGKGLHIDALCLSIIGGIQPGVLAEYVRQATGGGAGADGLLQRFGLMVYPDISPDWKEVDRYPDSTLREAVNLLAERLDNLNPADIGAEVDLYGGVPFLRFNDAAQVLFSEWRATLEHRLRSGEEHPAIVSHLSKYRKLIPSLALINHLCDTRQGAVSEAALLRAIAFGEYLESHAQRIYSYATRPDIDAAKTLLKRLASGKLSNPFKVREVYLKGWTGLETPAKAKAAIELLMEYHHLHEIVMETGGRPTSHFYLNEGA